MTTRRNVERTFLLSFVFILVGLLFLSCEKPVETGRDTEKLNILTEKVEKLTEKVNQLSMQVDEITGKLKEFSEKMAWGMNHPGWIRQRALLPPSIGLFTPTSWRG